MATNMYPIHNILVSPRLGTFGVFKLGSKVFVRPDAYVSFYEARGYRLEAIGSLETCNEMLVVILGEII